MLSVYRCDLHNHTAASPCADPELTPEVLVAVAIDRGLDVIAITDHNAYDHAAAALRAAAGTPLFVFPGMEITAPGEVHLLALFDTVAALQQVANKLFAPDTPRSPADVVSYGLAVLTDLIYEHGGIAIASHIDREVFSVLRCGGIPQSVRFDALEVSAACGIARARLRYPELGAYPLITSSDAHCAADIGRSATRIRMASPSIAELRYAFARSGGRSVLE